MKKSHFILLSLIFLLIVFIWLVPKHKPGHTPKPVFDYELSDIKSIEYKGEKNSFTLTPAKISELESPLVWKVQVQPKYEFIGSDSVTSMVRDLVKLEYKDETVNDPAKHEEYGLKNCLSYIKITADEMGQICLGKPNYNKTNLYIWVQGRDKVYTSSIYLFNRYEGDIFEKVNKKVFLHDEKQVKYLQIDFNKKVTKKYPLLFAGGKNSLKLFFDSEAKYKKKQKKEAGKRHFEWKFKDLPDTLHSHAIPIKNLFTQFHFSFVIHKMKDKPKAKPLLEASFHKGHTKNNKDQEKIIGQYKLWDASYPSRTRFVLSKKEKKPNRKHHLASSDYQSGVYSPDEIKKLYKRLQTMEDAIKKDKRAKANQAKQRK